MMIYIGDWNLGKGAMADECTRVLAFLITQDGRCTRIVFHLQSSSLNNRDWVVAFYLQDLVFPEGILNSARHLSYYSENHKKEHVPVIVDFGDVQSVADVPNLQLPRPTERDYAAAREQLQARRDALLDDNHEADDELLGRFACLLVSYRPLAPHQPVL